MTTREAQERWAKFWGQLPVLPEQRAAQQAAQRERLYGDSPVYEGLAQYTGNTVDKLARQPGDSAEQARRRLLSVARHLDPDEVEARLAAIDQAPQSHEQLREQLDGRTGTGTGILGNLTPQARAAVLNSRFGGREIEARGHLVVEPVGTGPRASMLQISEVLRAREQAEVQARQQATAAIRSSGTGIIGADK